MRNNQEIRLFSFLLFLLVPLVCSRQHTVAQQEPSKKETPVVVPSNAKELPKNWPWRGICIQSENSTPEDIDYLASVGVNFVRIQVKPSIRCKREKGDPKKCFYDELLWAEKMLDACKRNGITSLIAFNHLVLDPQKEIDDKSEEFWSDKSYADSTMRMVAILADRFKNRGDELSAYEVIGEPAVQQKGGAKVPPGLENFFRRTLQTIRKYDRERWFLLTPGPWGRPTNYAGFTPFAIEDARLIYGAHMYLPDPFTHQGIKKRERGYTYPGTIKGENWNRSTIENRFDALKKFEKTYGYPVYVGEFQATRWSPGAELWVKDVLEICDQYTWSWSMFAFEAGTEAWDPYFDVANKTSPSEEWTIQYVGAETPLWKYMLTQFARNPKN